jgi:hypothetical protein
MLRDAERQQLLTAVAQMAKPMMSFRKTRQQYVLAHSSIRE